MIISNVSTLSKRLLWNQNIFFLTPASLLIFLVIDIGLISLEDSCDFMVFFREKKFSVVFTPLLKDDIRN